MTAPSNGQTIRHAEWWRRTTVVSAVITITIGSLALLGWITGSRWLKGIYENLPAMNPMVAVCWIACGSCLLLLRKEPVSDRVRNVCRLLLGAVAVIAVIRMVTYALSMPALVDTLLFRDQLEQSVPPNRMAPNTAMGLFLSSLALVLLDWKTPQGRWPSQGMAVAAGLLSLVALVGNVYGSDEFSRLGQTFIPMALNSALALGALCAGILAARPRVGLMSVVTGDSPAGTLLRRLMPAAFAIPFFLGYLLWIVQESKAGKDFRLSLFVLGLILALMGLLWWVAASVNRSDRRRRHAEEELKRQSGTLESILQNLGDGVAVADDSGRILLMNPAGERILGRGPTGSGPDQWSREYGIYKVDGTTLFPESELPLARAVKGESVTDVELIIRNPHIPRGIWISATARPMRDSHDRLLGGVVVFRDISERKQAEQDLRDSRERARLIVDTAYDAFVAMDSRGEVVDWNRQAEETFGWTRDEVIGRSLADTIIPDRFREDHAAGLKHFLTTGESRILNRRIEIMALKRDGREFPVELTITPLRFGDTYLFNAFVHDITERKQAEQELKTARDAAEGANRAKSEFLANMSHEIRTPMNAIIGMTDLVLDTDLTPTQRDYLRMVEESGEALLTLINDILDFSKIEAGKLDLDHIPFGARERLGDAMRLLAFRAHDKGLELACRIHPEVPDALVGDPGRLRQVVVNLVGNAVKFTERGEVVLDVDCESQTDDHAVLHFTVTDTGIGMPPEKLKLLFRAFEQGDASTTRKYGGTGLGLAISRRLVELMGGRIWVESELGRGSRFHFTARFPLAAAGTLEAPIQAAVFVRNTPVLIVDDNGTNRLILEEMVRSWGMTPTAVATARDAIALLRRARDQDRAYRIVLADVNMPDVDGFTLTEWIRGDATLRSTIVIVLTSGARSGDAATCRDLGIAAHLMKPVKPSELFDAIGMALGISAPEDHEALATGEAFGSRRPLRILLAEDSVVNQKLALGLLGKHGHTVTVAGTGKEAVHHWESTDFDVILMDVQMPEMDGMEATAVIRAHETHADSHVPIIAMTAHAMKGDREQCIAAGMDDYVSKPIRAEHLFAAIDRALSRFPPPAVEAEAATPTDGLPVIDFELALKSVDGDPELLLGIIDAFLEECPLLVDRIRESIVTADAAVLQRSAHTLKGGLQTLAAPAPAELAKQLEHLGREGRPKEGEPLLAALRKALVPVSQTLVEYLGRHRPSKGTSELAVNRSS